MTVAFRPIVNAIRPLCAGMGLYLLLATGHVTPLAQAGNPEPGSDSLAGQFLIAEPDMNDPNFEQTVIFMLEHDAGGALGLVVNRPFARIAVNRLLGPPQTEDEADSDGELPEGEGQDIPVYSGGPVEPQRAFLLHSDDVMLPQSQTVANGVAVSGRQEMLRLIAQGQGPSRFLLILGYSGWGPGQLERELDTGSWDVAPVDREVLFDAPDGEKWQRARAARSYDL